MYPPMQISLRLCADPFVTVVEPGISVSEGLDSAGVLVELLVLPIITSLLSVPVGDLLPCPERCRDGALPIC